MVYHGIPWSISLPRKGSEDQAEMDYNWPFRAVAPVTLCFFMFFLFQFAGGKKPQQTVSLLHEPKKIGASLPFGELSI